MFRGDRSDSFERSRPSIYSGGGGVSGAIGDQEDDDDYFTDSDDPDPDRFVNFSLLSHLAVRLRDKVPRGTHVKSSIPYPRAFTGKDIVSTIQSQIQRELLINHGVSTADRRAALQVARSLQQQLFFYEVEWGDKPLQDGVEDVYMFLDDLEGGSESTREREELPTAVVTMLTKCYVSSCSEDDPCYSFACPRRRAAHVVDLTPLPEPEPLHQTQDWLSTVDPAILRSLPESEVHRQTIIHKTISQEEQYIQDLDTVEALFIRPLRHATSIMPADKLDEFVEEVFGNILDLRECNKRLLEAMYVRQREQAPIVQKIGDVFVEAARSFRFAYPTYVGHLPMAEKRFKEEMEANAELRLFLEECSRQSARQQESRRLDLKHFLTRPSEHLQKYPLALEAIMKETTEGNPDAYYLAEAIQAIKNLQNVSQLRTFQSAMGKGPTSKYGWHDLVAKDVRESLSKSEAKRQAIIFELIQGEMAYVKDLENIETMYVLPLREQDPPIVPRDRLNNFLSDVFHNFMELLGHHRKLLDQLHDIQRDEHPTIKSITAPLLDAALNFRDAYMDYIPNYPIAAYRIDDEMANNFDFKAFVEQCTRHPDAHRLDMKNFINRPIPRLLRYELLLKSILDETPPGHEDREAIPQVLEIIKSLGKDTEPGVQSSKQKVQLWNYNSNIQFKPGESVDMDLLNENRSLIHAGKLLRQPETGFEWNGWTELFVLLFDNYLVMTKTKEKDGVTKYQVNRRPVPLDLLNLASFNDQPIQRGTSILRLGLGGSRHTEGAGPTSPGSGVPDSAGDSRLVYPCTIHYSGRLGGLYTLFTESHQARAEWKQKLEEAIGLRKVVQESNKVFEMEPLSTDTFFVPALSASAAAPSWNHENYFTGKVTCSVPFTTADGRALVAIGCAEGVWIGFRHDSRSMRRVLHLKMVTQCAMLEDFGMFLVLADKALFAYHIEALVPSSPQSAHTSQTPQRVNGTRDVHFFSVGNQGGRTLVIYMKKKGLDSVFRVLEPVVEKINERSKAPASFTSRFGIRPARSEWFRLYREFFLPSESYDLVFLKAKIAILCTKGFEIMDLTDFKSVTIPLRDDGYERLAKRCESCKPMGMFRVDSEFLLCYDEFGLYVNKHGAPSRSTGTIEWEGTAERVAMHWPYILLFDSRFVEVRHVSTGLLAQIIPGNEIRCIWDGRGTSSGPAFSGADGFHQPMNLDPRIHAVMSAPEPLPVGGGGAAGRVRTTAQHVFELTPTIPLYPPGSLASPNHSTYFQQQQPSSMSPPHSPSLVPLNTWR
ncbi:CNH domain-containing protein [Phlebopus sp. FC_14]|nr:CNH domain-containing protein [Phlebopus sp. FC_14]